MQATEVLNQQLFTTGLGVQNKPLTQQNASTMQRAAHQIAPVPRDGSSNVAMSLQNTPASKIVPNSIPSKPLQATQMNASVDNVSKYTNMVKSAQQNTMTQIHQTQNNINQKAGEMSNKVMSGLQNAANQAVQTVDETLRMVDPALAGPQYQVNINGTIKAVPHYFDNHFAFQNNGPVGGGMRAAPKAKRGDKIKMMAGGDGGFTVTLITPDGEQKVTVDSETYILDAAEEAGIDLPYSCRAGACSSCAALVKEGTVDNSDQSFLDEDQMGEGFILSCVAYATSDCTIETHKEDDLF